MDSRLVENRSPLLNVMCRAVQRAARRLVRDFGEVEHLQVSKKGPRDFVSNADRQAEKTLFESLSKDRPDYGFLMEESGVREGRDNRYRWIIDPLDGTTNFLHGIPHFAISVALEKEGEILAGVTYNPVHDEMFYAERGFGAFLNDRRLRVSNRREPNEAVIGTDTSPHLNSAEEDDFVKRNRLLTSQVAGVRRFGASTLALAYVAAGRFDGYWAQNISPWDIAAGIILVREAGGSVSDLKGGQDMIGNRSILATNLHLHPSLTTLLGVK
jgi:myo-inositol-1(or 4)-monophosphatase